MTFTFAQRVQPLNGQILSEATDVELPEPVRRWSARDARMFPQAARQFPPPEDGQDLVLVVCNGEVWAVPAGELA